MNGMTRFALPLIASFAIINSSQADIIVDTGAGGYTSGYALTSTQWLGAQFQLDKNYTLTGINGWMSSWSGGAVQMSVTSIVNGLPSTSLYTTDITIGSRQISTWAGASGLAWDLQAGTYAVTFTPNDPGFDGAMAYDAPTPSGQMHIGLGGNWYSLPGSLGLQVFGVESATGDVPEPASIALLGIALAGLAASRRKRA